MLFEYDASLDSSALMPGIIRLSERDNRVTINLGVSLASELGLTFFHSLNSLSQWHPASAPSHSYDSELGSLMSHCVSLGHERVNSV